MISYMPLRRYLRLHGMQLTDLYCILSPRTVAKLGKRDTVTTETIDKICRYLNCQPGDIMEYKK